MEKDFNVVVKCRDGLFIANRNDMYIGPSLIKYGEFSHGEMVMFKTICAPDDIIVEVGANVGAHTSRTSKPTPASPPASGSPSASPSA